VSFPTWVWLYFGSFGTAGAVLYTLVVWVWMRVRAAARGSTRSVATWNMLGLMFLFIAAYFACGIGGPPGSLMSSDPSAHALDAAYDAALLSIFFSVPGWACMLVGIIKTLRGIRPVLGG
jgi:hypothetical protein